MEDNEGEHLSMETIVQERLTEVCLIEGGVRMEKYKSGTLLFKEQGGEYRIVEVLMEASWSEVSNCGGEFPIPDSKIYYKTRVVKQSLKPALWYKKDDIFYVVTKEYKRMSKKDLLRLLL